MRKLVVFTGAGLSADSGIQTFRDSNGLWENHNVLQVCHIHTWKRNREAVYKFYNNRRTQMADVEPNAAHQMVVDWQNRYDATIITQNIDDLLERAGASDVVHVHGRIENMQCQACGNVWSIGTAIWSVDDKCPDCGSKKGVKPGVVFFGEDAPLYARMRKTFKHMTDRDMLVVIGTSGAVIPIGSIASQINSRCVLNNLAPLAPGEWRPGMVSDEYFDHIFYGKAVDVVDQMNDVVDGFMKGQHYDRTDNGRT